MRERIFRRTGLTWSENQRQCHSDLSPFLILDALPEQHPIPEVAGELSKTITNTRGVVLLDVGTEQVASRITVNFGTPPLRTSH